MVLSTDEILALIDYYSALIGHIDLRIDSIKDSEATLLLDPDIIEEQINDLTDTRNVYENRLETLKAATNLF